MHTTALIRALSDASALAADTPAVATNFTYWDWAIVAVYLLASIAVGIYANKFIHKLSDYLVAGRGLGIYLAVATMTGTELGLVTVTQSVPGTVWGVIGTSKGAPVPIAVPMISPSTVSAMVASRSAVTVKWSTPVRQIQSCSMVSSWGTSEYIVTKASP